MVFSRARALSLLAEKRNRLISLIESGSDEGSFLKHKLARIHRVHKDVIIKKALIIGTRYYRNDKKCWDKQYHVIDVTCMRHPDQNSIIYARLENIHKGLNPCLLCMSELDEIGIMSLELNINRAAAYDVKKKHGYSVTQTKEYFSLKENLTSSKNKRQPALRKSSHYLKSLSIAEKIKVKLLRYSNPDPRRDKLIELMKTIDISTATNIKEGKIQYVRGIKCKQHPAANIDKKQLGRLLEGANPCQECQRHMRTKASKGKIKLRWTSHRVFERVKSDTELSQGISNFDISKIEIQFIKKGSRNCAHICGAICKEHSQVVPPLLVAHFLAGKVFCPDCQSSNVYTLCSARKMVNEAHNEMVCLTQFSGRISDKSQFKCNFCGHLWLAALNQVIGYHSKKTYRVPTGCPECASISNHQENQVASVLADLGYSNKCGNGSYIENVLGAIASTAKAFSRSVAISRKGNRELRADYLINTGNKIYVIEVDGPQHYGIRFRDYGVNEYKKVIELDRQKVFLLSSKYNIETCRLPLPLLSNEEIRNEIINITKNNPRWVGIPDKDWINAIS